MNKLAERESRERRDIRLNARKERNSIRSNFDLQRARMPKMQTAELMAFSQAAAATVSKREEAEMIAQIRYRQKELRNFNFRAYGGQSEEEARELGEMIAQQRTQYPHVNPHLRQIEDTERQIKEELDRAGTEQQHQRRNGGLTQRERHFRNEARMREKQEEG